MMNDMRLQAGLPKLGNILPLLYMLGDRHPEVYNDVTVGYHGFSTPKDARCPFCMEKLHCVVNGERQGLTAAPGWDAVTGFGSMNFERMIRFVLPVSARNATAPASARVETDMTLSSKHCRPTLHVCIVPHQFRAILTPLAPAAAA